MALVRVFSPANESELMAVVALLEAHEIPCVIHNAVFGALYPGVLIDNNSRAIMVTNDKVLAARELIHDFQTQPGLGADEDAPEE